MSVSVLAHLNTTHPFKWLEKSVLPSGCLSGGSEGRHPSGRWGTQGAGVWQESPWPCRWVRRCCCDASSMSAGGSSSWGAGRGCEPGCRCSASPQLFKQHHLCSLAPTEWTGTQTLGFKASGQPAWGTVYVWLGAHSELLRAERICGLRQPSLQ